MVERVEYDEFGLFHENAAEYGLAYDGPPIVRRVAVEVEPGRKLSALVWGDAEPELVLIHGGAQNAHTWDTVAMALGRPLLAVDLPGHGHSDGPGEIGGTEGNARDLAVAIAELAPQAKAIVGMSFGGQSTIALARYAPELVRKILLVDTVPRTGDPADSERGKHISDFTGGPSSFENFDELLERTVRFNPTRSPSSLRRGILHNAEQQEDGTWVWRWARHRPPASAATTSARSASEPGELWNAVEQIKVPLLLARGMRPDSVVSDLGEAELLRRLPSARVVHFAEAGHSLQGDTPLELAALIDQYVFAG
jgi:pimeloyl-ACP methyl ester carboxylesterase